MLCVFSSFELWGKVFLLYFCIEKVVCILISLTIAEVFHCLGRGVS